MLSVKDMMTLELEERRWKFAGAKAAHIRTVFGESETIYYARLHRLLEQPEALAHAPQTVNRLRRLREARQRQRGARRVGWAR